MTCLGKSKSFIISLMLLGAMVTSSLAQSSPPINDVTLNQIADTLTMMGYSPSKGQDILSFNAGPYVVSVERSGDNSTIYFEIIYGIQPDKASKVPALKLLSYNRTHRTYAWLTFDNNNPTRVGVYIQLTSQAFSAKTMRLALSTLMEDLTANQAILDPIYW